MIPCRGVLRLRMYAPTVRVCQHLSAEKLETNVQQEDILLKATRYVLAGGVRETQKLFIGGMSVSSRNCFLLVFAGPCLLIQHKGGCSIELVSPNDVVINDGYNGISDGVCAGVF